MFLPCNQINGEPNEAGTNLNFPKNCWSASRFGDFCEARVGVRPLDPSKLQAYWGAGEDGWRNSPRLLLSNGRLDPWGYGGVPGGGVKGEAGVLWIPNSAHHLDLRSPNPADPPSVAAARERGVSLVLGWLTARESTG